MKHGHVVVSLLLPTDQQTAETVQPGVRSLHHPTACAVMGNSLLLVLLLPARFDGRRVAPEIDEPPNAGIVIPFVCTKMLLNLRQRVGTWHHHAVECRADQAHVMHIGAGHDHRQRYAVAIRKQASLRARFAPIGRVSSGFFPRRAVPS